MLNRRSMQFRLQLFPLVSFFLLLFSLSAHSEVKFSGFGTLAGGMTTGSDEVFEVSRGNTYDDKYDFKPDSLFGLQASADLGEGMKATAQITARGADDWNASFEWAYLSFDITDDWRLLLGRQRSPQYLYSDFIDVSYAYHWLRAPSGIYAPSFDSYDGIGSIYNFNFGDVENQLHFFIGRSNDNPFGDLVHGIDIANYIIAAYTLNWDWLTARVSYTQREISVVLTEGFSYDAAFGAFGLDMGSDVDVDYDDNTIVSLSLRADFGMVFGVTEYKQEENEDNFLGETDNWYVSLGTRISSWTLHVTYGANETTVDDSVLDPAYALSSSGNLPAGPAQIGFDALLNGAQRSFDGSHKDQEYFIIGARWDFHSSSALQIEYTDFKDVQDYSVTPTKSEGLGDSGVFVVGVVTVF